MWDKQFSRNVSKISKLVTRNFRSKLKSHHFKVRFSCLTAGRRVAELELHIAMAHIMQNFRVEFSESAPVGIVQKFFLTPDRPINLAFVDLQ